MMEGQIIKRLFCLDGFSSRDCKLTSNKKKAGAVVNGNAAAFIHRGRCIAKGIKGTSQYARLEVTDRDISARAKVVDLEIPEGFCIDDMDNALPVRKIQSDKENSMDGRITVQGKKKKNTADVNRLMYAGGNDYKSAVKSQLVGTEGSVKET
jgi:hypothetical protein